MLPAIRGVMRLLGSAAAHGKSAVSSGRTARSGPRGLSIAVVPRAFMPPACLLLAAFALAPSPAAAQSEGELRIVPLEADRPERGRLEIFHTPASGTGRWGPICDDAFRMDEAKVACKQMGYRDAENYILRYSKDYAHTEAAYWLDDMDCNGSESKFTDCRQQNTRGGGYFSSLQWGQHDCNRLEQVGLQCTVDTASNYTRVDKRALTVVEGLSATFRVWLGKAPSGNVTVTMTVNSGPDLTLEDSGGTEISTLTFTTSNWSDPQTVTVEAASDTDTTDDTGITIGFSAAGGGYAAATVQQDVRVTIRDDDVKGFAIAPTSLNSFETEELNRRQVGGVAAGDRTVSSTVGDPPVTSYTVRMKGPPSANVTVALAVTANTPGGTGEADVSFEPSTLTFTTSDWSTPQTVTPKVTGDADHIAETVTISHTVTSTDSGYDGMDLPDVTMEVKETEPPYTSGLSVSNATANEDDDPPELDFEVTLWPPSSETVTVKYKTIDRTATAGEDYIHTSGTLTFDPGVTGLKVRVTIINDNVEDDGETLWLKLTDPSGAFFDDSWGLGTIDNTETGGDNTAPTGLPTISGTAQVGETLTASSAGIADADGLTDAAFAWQWIADDEDIADATDATWTLTAAEQGKTVKVRATFTDDGGTEETLTSAATEAVAAAVQQQVASDTEAPTVAVTSDATGPVTGDFDVTVTFSEPVTGFEMSELTIVNGTASAMTGNEAGDVYTVTVTPDGGASGTLSVEVPAGVASDAAENANTASGTFGIAVRTALTASFSSVAREHDGSSVFLVPLDFSEDVVGLSYRTLKFGGIEVTGGTVRRAKRRPPGSGQGKYWTIHVEPDTDGDVTVVLPETTDCAATGAVCTQDGRMLANASRATIPGPASTPLVSIAAGTSPVTEGTASSFTLTRRGGPATALTVDVSVSEDGAMVDGTAPSTATFAANSTTATLTVATADDEVEESASTVTATVSSGTGYAPEPGAESASVTVENDDGASANAKPTGLPTISGTAKVGETLTASKTGIADADGLTDATFAWQWIANDGNSDTEIEGATEATWTLTAAEEGKTVRVRATFTDDGGREETLESAATEAVAALSTDPVWTATVTVAADGSFRGFSSMPNPDIGSVSGTGFEYGPESARRYTVQIVGANADGVLFKARSGNDDLAAMYLEWAGETLPLAAAGRQSDGRFVWSQSWLTANAPSLSAASYVSTLPESGAVPVCLRTVGQSCPATATGAANAAPTGLPTISGTARVGETLTAASAGIADADGLTGASFAWQWIANDGTNDTDIADATDATWTLTSAEEGKTVKVRVTFTDDGGTEETLVSAATAEVAAALPRVSIAAASSPVTEGAAAAFTLRRTGDTTAALTVSVSAGEAGSVLSGTPASSATFAAGNAETALSLATENDAVDEADARVTVSVSAGTGYTVDAEAASAGVDVYDDDAAAPGETTVTTLWSTTLQWADWNGNVIANAADFTNAGWSEDGNDFKVWYFAYDPWDGTLWLRLNSSGSAGDIPRAGELTLHIGDEAVEAGDALSAFAAGSIGTVSGVQRDWEEGDRVSVRLTRTVGVETTAALPGLSVEDAQAREADGATLPFVVTLGEAQTGAVSVRYATSDGTATAGLDYEAVSGMLRFAPGETSKTVSVPVIDDSHDDDGETVTLTLSQPFGATISDGTATGTIQNADPMPRAWIARFGRTVAAQVLEAVESRMRAPRTAGVAVSLGGRQVGVAAADGGAQKAGKNLAELSGDGNEPESRLGLQGQTMTQREFLLGSSFSVTGGTERDGTYALWGRGAVTHFDGRDGTLSLDGEVTSAMLGADWSRDALMAGLVVSHSLGEGSYRGEGGDGGVTSSLTGLYPWARYALSERVSVWGVMGYGEGTLTLTPEGDAPIDADLDLGMAAAGLRGVLVEAPETGGLELAVKSDVLGVRTGTAKAQGLAAADADVTRLRLGVEGSLPSRFEGRASLTPSMEIGVRRDGGDAETGFGVDFGGGLSWSDPRRGLSAELRGRGLLSHEADGFRERGFSGSLSWDPTPETARGLSLSMSRTVGVQAAGGMGALLERDTLAGLVASDDGEDELARRRLEMRLGYGFGVFGGRFTATPGLGLAMSDAGREAVLGWRLEGAGGQGFELRVEGARLEPANDGAEHRIGLSLGARW